MHRSFRALRAILTLSSLVLAAVAPAAAQSGLRGRVTDRQSGDALAGATVQVAGSPTGTVADLDGRYALSVRPGRYTLQISYVGYRTARVEVTVAAGTTTEQDVRLQEDLIGADEVVVVGSRSSTERTVIESVVPVDVLGAAEIRATGQTETTQILQLAIPSYNAPRSSISDGTDHIRAATLRGLGPDQVLILVNGKRRHTSSLVHINGTVGRGSTGVDLNALPASAIGRIEVLRDGAAAQYGSDAIAGVINVILRDDEGADAQVTYGGNVSTVTRGYTATEALRPEETAASYNWDDPAEVGGQRIGAPSKVTYRDGQAIAAHIGYGFRPLGGRVYVSAQVRQNSRANRAGLDPRQQYYTGFNAGQFGAEQTEATFDRDNHRYGNGDFTELSSLANVSVPISGTNAQVYAFGGLSSRVGVTGCFFRPSQDNRTNRTLYPDGFLPEIKSGILDLSFAGGVKGVFGPWAYDASQTLGQNTFDFTIQNSHNASIRPASQTSFDAGQLGFRQATTNLDVFRALPVGLATPLSIALGAEFRAENYTIDAGEEASYLNGGGTVADGPNTGAACAAGSQCFPGFQPRSAQDESRTNVGLYADLETDLVRGVTVSTAGRVERYSDAGTTVTGKVAGRVELPAGFAVRGAVSTGFRAPSLAQSYFTSIATNNVGGQLLELGTFSVTSPLARALGAKDLEPETSTNLSLGLTFARGPAAITVDAFQIEIDDRITFTENFTGAQVTAFLASQGVSATGGRFFTNALDTRTRGLDVTARFGAQAGPGTLRLVLAGNLNETDVTNATTASNNAFNRLIAAPEQLRTLGQPALVGRQRINDYERAQPRSKVSAQATYELGRVSLMLRATRYGEVTVLDGTAPDATTGLNSRDQTYGARALADAELGVRLPRGINIAVGGNNLFDVYPDKVLKFNSVNGVTPYSGFSPFGFTGRYLYTRVGVRF